jgi:endonuclease/exonuclease/phosphatase family metal-dependent hydrolase
MKNKKWIVFYCCSILMYGCVQKKLHGNTAAHKNFDARSTELKILNYNIHHANPPSKQNFIDVEAIAKVIRQQSPDIIALQEVDVFTNRSGKTVDEATEIARLSGMPYHYFAKAIDHDGGEYGVAILSRYPMENMKNNPLPTVAETKGEPRILATAVIHLPEGKKIVFACTHLDAQKADTNRFLQINKITEILQQEKLPVIIAGDFNATPTSRIINRLDEFFTRTSLVDGGFTIPVEKPNKTIDFIAYKPASYFNVVEHKIIDEKYASDHLPGWAIVRVK